MSITHDILDFRPLIAEALATFGLVFFGGMAVMHADNGNLSLLGVATAHFLILTFMVYFSRPVSGGHVNPAVTVGFVMTGRMDSVEGLFYILSQLIGSLIAAMFLIVLPGESLLGVAANNSGLGFPHIAEGYNPMLGATLELILTFFWVFMVWMTTVDDKAPSSIYGAAIGGALGLGILVGGPLTGAALNPARVFGPALVTLDFAHHWIYWVGPLLGGIIGALIYHFLFLDHEVEK